MIINLNLKLTNKGIEIPLKKIRFSIMKLDFTDLGIELSQLFFYKKPEERKRLKKSIYLRLSIIAFFFIGCISGGFIYNALQLKTLFVAATFLLIALLYDYIRLSFFVIKRKAIFKKAILNK